MARRSEIYGSGEWMKAAKNGNIEMDGEPREYIGQIRTIGTTKFDDGRQQAVIEWADENVPKLGLNATNWDAIAHWTRKEDDADWPGEWVEVFVVPDGSKMAKSGYCLRVRQPRPDAIPRGTAPPPQGRMAAAYQQQAPTAAPLALGANAPPVDPPFGGAWAKGVFDRLNGCVPPRTVADLMSNMDVPVGTDDVAAWPRSIMPSVKRAIENLQNNEDLPF